MKKLQTLVRIFPYAADNQSNPWGDYDHILQLSTRFPPEDAEIGIIPPSLYFRISKHSGYLEPISEETFKEACVAAIYKQANAHLQDFDLK